MAIREDDRNVGYRNPLGNMTIDDAKVLYQDGRLDDYMRQKINSRRCLPKNTCAMNEYGCFHCENHLLEVKKLFE